MTQAIAQTKNNTIGKYERKLTLAINKVLGMRVTVYTECDFIQFSLARGVAKLNRKQLNDVLRAVKPLVDSAFKCYRFNLDSDLTDDEGLNVYVAAVEYLEYRD